MPFSRLHAPVAEAVVEAGDNLRDIFGERLRAFLVHGSHARTGARPTVQAPIQTLALVNGAITYADLVASAAYAEAWHRRGLAVPLMLDEHEFARSLDAFPLEYGDIIAHHVVIIGDDPFADVRVARADIRRACEIQIKSHVIHLREGFVECGGEPVEVARLLVRSAPPFAAILGTLARLDDQWSPEPDEVARHLESRTGLSASVAARILALEGDARLSPDEASQLYPPYLELVQALSGFVDSWIETPVAR
jgi:hypothetical protein